MMHKKDQDQTTRTVTRMMQELQLKNQIEEANRKALESKGGIVGHALMAEKGKRGHAGKESTEIITNVYGMVPKSTMIYRYDIGMKGVFASVRNGTEASMDLMRAIGDTRIVEKRYMRGRAYHHFIQQWLERIGPGFLFYDTGAILYSNVILNLDSTSPRGIFRVSNLDQLTFSGMQYAQIDIKPTTDADFTLSVDDLRASIQPDLNLTNLYLVQYLDILTSQDATLNTMDFFSFSSSELYLEAPLDHGFTPEDLPQYHANRTHLEVGVRKSTRFVEGPGGKGFVHPAQVISLHKRDFYDACPLIDRMRDCVGDLSYVDEKGVEILNNSLGGLWVVTSYGNRQVIRIRRFVNTRPEYKTFVRDGKQTTVGRYFLEVYNHVCQPYPLVEVLSKIGLSYYPSELLETAPYQRVPLMRQDRDVESTMIKAMAVPPVVRYKHESRLKDLLQLGNSDTLDAGGARLISDRLVVTNARILPAPSITFSDAQILPAETKGNLWDGGKYIRPATLTRWSIVGLCSDQENINEGELSTIGELLVHHGTLKGMTMSKAKHLEVLSCDFHVVRDFVLDAKGRGDEFILIVHPNALAGDDAHGQMKVWERVSGIATQGLLIKTARQAIVEGQPVTIANVLNKTNLKLGGLNYSVKSDVIKATDLIIGIGATHPRPKDIQTSNDVSLTENGKEGNGQNGNGENGHLSSESNGNGHNGNGNGVLYNGRNGASNGVRFRSKRFPPSVIGYSANVGPSCDPCDFIGDFMLQEVRRDEKPELIARLVRACVEKFQNVRGYNPTRIIIFRNAIAEGQWSSILKYEIPFIEMELDNISILVDPVVIVPNKRHRVRFYPAEINSVHPPTQQNVKVGTVIDTTVVHPAHAEFYLCPHNALQGTAKVPRYTVLHNEAGMEMNEIQLLSHALSFGHQIVNSPTSLPTPVFVAEEYAKRGLNVFCDWYRAGNYAQEEIEEMSLARIEELIAYKTSRELSNRRINA